MVVNVGEAPARYPATGAGIVTNPWESGCARPVRAGWRRAARAAACCGAIRAGADAAGALLARPASWRRFRPGLVL